jgi:C1A family cysteine protease
MDKKIVLLGLVALTGLMVYLESQEEKVTADSGREGLLGEFAAFKEAHGKSYSSLSEMEYRLGVFQENLKTINAHNADLTQTYTLGVNQFSDMTFEEFAAYYLGEDPMDSYQPGQEADSRLFRPSTDEEKKVDWREHNIVNKVKNQDRCGSCWAFSAISVVEEAYALFKKVEIPTLSEQELVDCSGSYGNYGCDGGLSFQGLSYIRDRGINLDKDYPYNGEKNRCRSIAGKGAYHIKEWQAQPPGPAPLVKALRKQPTTVSFHVQLDFMSYKSGIYNPISCPGHRNHAVNAVGFNLDHEIPHLIVKNSWGTKWGDQGFFNIALKEGNGTCWINGEGRTTIPILLE